jgi:hypothetical protein
MFKQWGHKKWKSITVIPIDGPLYPINIHYVTIRFPKACHIKGQNNYRLSPSQKRGHINIIHINLY